MSVPVTTKTAARQSWELHLKTQQQCKEAIELGTKSSPLCLTGTVRMEVVFTSSELELPVMPTRWVKWFTTMIIPDWIWHCPLYLMATGNHGGSDPRKNSLEIQADLWLQFILGKVQLRAQARAWALWRGPSLHLPSAPFTLNSEAKRLMKDGESFQHKSCPWIYSRESSSIHSELQPLGPQWQSEGPKLPLTNMSHSEHFLRWEGAQWWQESRSTG